MMKWIWFLMASSALAQNTAPAAPASSRNAMQVAIEKQRGAAAIQRKAVRKQVEMAAEWRSSEPLPMETPEAPETPCDPMADADITPIIDAAARTQNVQTKLLRAVIEKESAFRPCAISVKGAKGLMQLMPDTGEQLGVRDLFDPKENIEAGAKFLKQLIDKYKGDLSLALGAYNAGPATVDQAGKLPDFPETRDYVETILKRAGATNTDPPHTPTPKPIEN